MKYNFFIGRWSPFHAGHKYIIDSFVNNDKPVCVAIRDTSIDEKNPFSAKSRKKMIEAVYEKNDKVKVIIIPDIETVAVGRGVGYGIMEVPEEIRTISATKVRSGQSSEIPEEVKKALNDGNGLGIWLTGIPSAGKTTLGNKLDEILQKQGYDTERLDGDIVRKSLCTDLGFTKEDRAENLRRVSSVAKILVDHGAVTICSFVSPYQCMRDEIYKRIGKVVEVYVKCSADVCAHRDVKGLWKKAKEGKIERFTGYNDPYEQPANPDVIVNTEIESVDESINKILRFLDRLKALIKI